MRASGVTRLDIGYIALPACVAERAVDEWVDPRVWATGTADEISRSVFRMLGDRTAVVAPLQDEDALPTRGVFVTLDHAIHSRDVVWPLGVAPLVYVGALSMQRVPHYHAAFVLPYLATNVRDVERACGFPAHACTRLKTSWWQVVNYISHQATQLVEYTVRRREAELYRDPMRAKSQAHAAHYEHVSLGLPSYFDDVTPRKPWKYEGLAWDVRPLADTWFIDAHDIFLSPLIHDIGQRYLGQFAVATPRSMCRGHHAVMAPAACYLIAFVRTTMLIDV
jgi:hypothetical protein